jgi:hypothetical protein
MLKIESLKEEIEKGNILKLPNCSSIGGYPLYYISSYNNLYCANCANELLNCEYEDITNYDINYEDDSMYCECGNKINSAYGEDEETFIDIEEKRKNLNHYNLAELIQECKRFEIIHDNKNKIELIEEILKATKNMDI